LLVNVTVQAQCRVLAALVTSRHPRCLEAVGKCWSMEEAETDLLCGQPNADVARIGPALRIDRSAIDSGPPVLRKRPSKQGNQLIQQPVSTALSLVRI